MPNQDGTEAIADDEILYRRIPASTNWYEPDKERPLSQLAFNPTKEDPTGLSLVRKKYKTIQEAGMGRGKSYFVAILRAGDLRAKGIEVAPRPEPGDPGHAEIPGLTHENRRDNRSRDWKVLLAHKLCLGVEGPFPKP